MNLCVRVQSVIIFPIFFQGGGARFHFGGRGPNVDPGLYNKQSITGHQYYNEILPESTAKPYIILFYSDWCFTCLRDIAMTS